MNRSTSIGWLSAVALALVASGSALAGLSPGQATPMLSVKVIGGDRTGETFCVAHDRGTKPFVVLTVSVGNTMQADFLSSFDAYVGGLRAKGLRAFVLLQGQLASDPAWAKNVYAQRHLSHTSLVLARDPSQMGAWQPNRSFETNTWLSGKGKFVRGWPSHCAHCEDLLGKIKPVVAEALRT